MTTLFFLRISRQHDDQDGRHVQLVNIKVTFSNTLKKGTALATEPLVLMSRRIPHKTHLPPVRIPSIERQITFLRLHPDLSVDISDGACTCAFPLCLSMPPNGSQLSLHALALSPSRHSLAPPRPHSSTPHIKTRRAAATPAVRLGERHACLVDECVCVWANG